jgi:hypothetical protein
MSRKECAVLWIQPQRHFRSASLSNIAMPLALTALTKNITYSSVNYVPSSRYKLTDFQEVPVLAASDEKEIKFLTHILCTSVIIKIYG